MEGARNAVKLAWTTAIRPPIRARGSRSTGDRLRGSYVRYPFYDPGSGATPVAWVRPRKTDAQHFNIPLARAELSAADRHGNAYASRPIGYANAFVGGGGSRKGVKNDV
jgi:hypothetical protein